MKVKIIRRAAGSDNRLLSQHLHPVLQRIYANRGISQLEQLERSLQRLFSYHNLPDIDKAVARLQFALQEQQRILIVGDFDADGATSTVVAVKGLIRLGATTVDYLVPNRFDFGYGLSPELVRFAAKEKQPDLIVTVDNGVSSVSGVQLANELGIDVVITDHHLAAEQLPQACAIVNPNMPGSEFPSKNLAGVGVIFYTLLALRFALRESNWFTEVNLSEPNLADLLDVVALGTVADVVPLDQNNRILVYQGLERIKRGRACVGVQALLTVSQRSMNRLAASDLGFAIGPRLNAAGRLEDMSLGIECLLTEDYEQALAMATQLDALNKERQALEREMQAEALTELQQLHLDEEQLPAGVCLYQQHWHQGVIGILASRIKERVHRPVVCCAQASDNEVKGSARSITGCHIRDVLANIANKEPGLITKFGGHAMAAGLSLPVAHVTRFQELFAAEVQAVLSAEDFVNKIYSDGPLPVEDISLPMAQLLKEAGPWGQAFPEPTFDDEFEVLQQREVGEKHLKLTLAREDYTVDAIAFNYDKSAWSSDTSAVKAAYRLDINEFRGQRSVQLIIEHLQAIPEVL